MILDPRIYQSGFYFYKFDVPTGFILSDMGPKSLKIRTSRYFKTAKFRPLWNKESSIWNPHLYTNKMNKDFHPKPGRAWFMILDEKHRGR